MVTTPRATPARARDMDAGTVCRLILAANLLLVVALVAAGYALAGVPDKLFRGHAIGSYLSGAQILAIACTCLLVFRVRQATPEGRPAVLWALLALGFAYLAVDEVGEVHELLDKIVHRVLGMQETALSDRLDDLIVLFYGLGGLAVLWSYRAELVRFRGAAPVFLAACGVFVAMVVLDLLTTRADVLLYLVHPPRRAKAVLGWLKAAEEGSKLVGEGLFLATAWACLGIARDRRARAPGVGADATRRAARGADESPAPPPA